MTNTKKANKTTFETINAVVKDFSNIFTLQNNEVNQYARVCFTDTFKKDYYNLMRDFAIYYDRKDSYKISISDKYLTATQCKDFKSTHEKSDKTKALEFSVKADSIKDVILELVAIKLLQTNKIVEYTKVKIKTTTANKRSNKKKEQTA